MIDWWGLIITVSFGVSVSLLILTAYAATSIDQYDDDYMWREKDR